MKYGILGIKLNFLQQPHTSWCFSLKTVAKSICNLLTYTELKHLTISNTEEPTMPTWFMEALRNHQFTSEETSSVAKQVVAIAAARSEQAESVKPTESDLQRRYNM